MTNGEYLSHVATALRAVSDGCAKYMQKNPNAKYTGADGKDAPLAYAIDIARRYAKSLEEAAAEIDGGAENAAD